MPAPIARTTTMAAPTPHQARFARFLTVSIWLALLGMTWSLPVLSYLHTRHQRAALEAGPYYQGDVVPQQIVIASAPMASNTDSH